MDDIRQSILSLDNNFKVLSTHYDRLASAELKTLNEQINDIEKRWTKLIDNLEQCSARVRSEKYAFQSLIIFFDLVENY